MGRGLPLVCVSILTSPVACGLIVGSASRPFHQRFPARPQFESNLRPLWTNCCCCSQACRLQSAALMGQNSIPISIMETAALQCLHRSTAAPSVNRNFATEQNKYLTFHKQGSENKTCKYSKCILHYTVLQILTSVSAPPPVVRTPSARTTRGTTAAPARRDTRETPTLG